MRKIFKSSVKLIANDSNIDIAFSSMHQSVVIKILLAKVRLLKKLWNMTLRFMGVSTDENNTTEKCI